jgi:putative tryptophan/tyrosine transport system substrate-binding protein
LRILFITYIISLFFSAVNAFAGDILVLQSMRVKPFDDALAGFRSTCGGASRIVMVENGEETDIVRMTQKERPELILAIGAEALNRVKKIRGIPVIYLMVLNPDKITGEGKNFVGVNMYIPPDRYLSLMEKLNLHRLKIGVFYDPAKSGNFMRNIRQTAGSRGMDITAREVRHSKEVPELLSELKGSFDLFWMLPDTTVVTPETVEILALFSQQNGVPIISFSGKYLESGALASLDIDGFDQGRQAGEMANRILGGTAVSDIPNADARKAILKVNRKIAAKLGINLKALDTDTIRSNQ